MIDLVEAAALVEKVKRLAKAGDDEAAHSVEDDLHLEVLKAIASGRLVKSRNQQLAAIAVLTEGIKFYRWGG